MKGGKRWQKSTETGKDQETQSPVVWEGGNDMTRGFRQTIEKARGAELTKSEFGRKRLNGGGRLQNKESLSVVFDRKNQKTKRKRKVP